MRRLQLRDTVIITEMLFVQTMSIALAVVKFPHMPFGRIFGELILSIYDYWNLAGAGLLDLVPGPPG
ncbi:MAG: hypothetical protein K0Q79_43 [Flavipsychrobacter sp.]|jgi:hypothetical protein|nr:hypothetical protein [Flavipsychrobacter sp.]